MGLFLRAAGASDAYTLFCPMASPVTYLIDKDGREVHRWTSAWIGTMGLYLLEDGSILRTSGGGVPSPSFGGASGRLVRIERITWDGDIVVWTYELTAPDVQLHHDIEPLPNGNVLAIAWELISPGEALEAGRDPAYVDSAGLWPDVVFEIEPDGVDAGRVVWEWHVWDHLVQDRDPTKSDYGVVADHPERIDVNFPPTPSRDWQHTNGLAYNPALDQIVLSANFFSEVWIIDHSTTTAQAASRTGGRYGRGGDLLYRTGNPAASKTGAPEDQWLYGQHDPRWIGDGPANLLVFNNGRGSPPRGYSSVEELMLPYEPDGSYRLSTAGGSFEEPVFAWRYVAPTPTDFYASFISGAARLAGGNTLICDGPAGRFFEVTEDGTTVWDYVNPVNAAGPLPWDAPVPEGTGGLRNNVFRATPVPPSHPGLSGRDLTPGAPIEIGGP